MLFHVDLIFPAVMTFSRSCLRKRNFGDFMQTDLLRKIERFLRDSALRESTQRSRPEVLLLGLVLALNREMPAKSAFK
jgi:hypothetical protein